MCTLNIASCHGTTLVVPFGVLVSNYNECAHRVFTLRSDGVNLHHMNACMHAERGAQFFFWMCKWVC